MLFLLFLFVCLFVVVVLFTQSISVVLVDQRIKSLLNGTGSVENYQDTTVWLEGTKRTGERLALFHVKPEN